MFNIYSATRIAPTKVKLSIPRKELNAVVLVCEKLLYRAESLVIPLHNIYAHTDSLVSMHWISKNKNNLKLYVSNRVANFKSAIIQILIVPGKFDPADLVIKPQASKGHSNNKFWTTGSSFLKKEDNDWLKKCKLEEVI